MQSLSENKQPAIDLQPHAVPQTATFAMGCFWGPEALFGVVEGVFRTRVGYAGGTTLNPTYRTLADHMETVQIEFDAAKISFMQLLQVFFGHHTPTKEPRKRQYSSALFFHSPEQEQQVHQTIAEIETKLGQKILTEVLPFQTFYLAEERHQKWKLRRAPELLAELEKIYPAFEDFNNSTAVAKVNGYVGGNGQQEVILEELPILGLSYSAQNQLLAHFLSSSRQQSI